MGPSPKRNVDKDNTRFNFFLHFSLVDERVVIGWFSSPEQYRVDVHDLHFRLHLTVVWCSHFSVLGCANWAFGFHPGPVVFGFWQTICGSNSKYFFNFTQVMDTLRNLTPLYSVLRWERAAGFRRNHELNCVDLSSRSCLRIIHPAPTFTTG